MLFCTYVLFVCTPYMYHVPVDCSTVVGLLSADIPPNPGCSPRKHRVCTDCQSVYRTVIRTGQVLPSGHCKKPVVTYRVVLSTYVLKYGRAYLREIGIQGKAGEPTLAPWT